MTTCKPTRARAAPAPLLCVLSLALAAPALLGQAVPEAPEPDSTVRFVSASPTGAFLRAVLVPGWGHASIGSHNRGGFYFTLEAITAYGILRTRQRVSQVAARVEFREGVLREDLAAQGITDFAEIEAALDADEALTDARGLEDSRRQQQEDWLALGIFLLLLSGADAFVSAHLQDFPAPIEMQAAPVGDGRIELGLRVPLGPLGR